ncbi:MAG: caspase family protein [Burkholderiales bacterium]|nr:caspase family protein [Burkholderiales bacterium]
MRNRIRALLLLLAENPQALIPLLVLRYTLQRVSWNNTVCDETSQWAYLIERYSTINTQLLTKCSRQFSMRKLSDWIKLVEADDWWRQVLPSIDHGRPWTSESLLYTEASVRVWRGRAVWLQAFIRAAPAGLDPIKIREAAQAGREEAAHRALRAWAGDAVNRMTEYFIDGNTTVRLGTIDEPLRLAGPDVVGERIRQMVDANFPAQQPAALDSSTINSQIHAMIDAGQQRTPVATPAVSRPPTPIAAPASQAAPPPVLVASVVTASPTSVSPASVSPASVSPTSVSPTSANRPTTPSGSPPAAPAAPPGPSVSELAAEVSRLRDELKRQQAQAAAQQASAASAAASAAAAAASAAPAATAAPLVVASPTGPAIAAKSRRLALVIGNDSYGKVSGLKNARGDARAVGDALVRLGYSVTVRTDLNERTMKDELRQFKARIEGGDEVVFYFAGHGIQLAGANFLLPTDIRGDSEDQVRDDALPLQKVLDDIQDRKARFTLAIVDACRDNPFRGTGRMIGTRGLAPTSAATGQMVMFSAGSGQQALDKLGERDRTPNGVFTRALLAEIDRPGISVDRILRTVRTRVVELAKSVGHEQVPALYDQSIGEYFFRN